MFTKTRSIEVSACANSGLPPSGIVATTLPDFASMTVADFERPLKARARESQGWEKGAEVAVEIDPSLRGD